MSVRTQECTWSGRGPGDREKVGVVLVAVTVLAKLVLMMVLVIGGCVRERVSDLHTRERRIYQNLVFSLE